MGWNSEWINSLIWVAEAYATTLCLFVMAVWILRRTTRWGHQFWALTGAYFVRDKHWRPLGGLALILLLTLCAVRIDVLFSSWYNQMYSALQKLDRAGFWMAIALFGSLATAHVVRALLSFYLQQRFVIHWRQWLNDRLLDQWLNQQAYYRTLFLTDGIDNPDQRIQQDVANFVSSSLSLSMGVVSAIVSTIAFTQILWSLSGPLILLDVTIPKGMVFAVYLYVLFVTVFAVLIGRPLIALNFLSEKLNADYRYGLVRLREYAESIAFYLGEVAESQILKGAFGRVIGNAWAIVYRALKFQGFNFVASQAAVVFPFVIQSARFFSKQISLGDLMQTAQAFGSLQDNLSYFRTAYDEFAGYRATLNRLDGFTRAIDTAQELPRPLMETQGNVLVAERLVVRTPDGRTLLKDLSLALHAAQSLLIRGPSGTGKTTLLRVFAGLWPYCEGRIKLPADNAMFLAQKPYVPLGTLRQALCYPHAATAYSSEAIEQIMTDIHLVHLSARLDETLDWSRVLSLGEQQRLAFGRLLLAAPRIVFLDEATSAMDEELEHRMYSLLRERLPQCIVISVGHRSTLSRHHDSHLSMLGEGKWALTGTAEPLPALMGSHA